MDTLTALRRRRLALGIPLRDLARAVGLSDATLSRVERGQIRPSYELVERIDAFLQQREGLVTSRLTVADVMNRSPATVASSAPLATAAHSVEVGGFSQLPVVDEGPGTGVGDQIGDLGRGEPGVHRHDEEIGRAHV